MASSDRIGLPHPTAAAAPLSLFLERKEIEVGLARLSDARANQRATSALLVVTAGYLCLATVGFLRERNASEETSLLAHEEARASDRRARDADAQALAKARKALEADQKATELEYELSVNRDTQLAAEAALTERTRTLVRARSAEGDRATLQEETQQLSEEITSGSRLLNEMETKGSHLARMAPSSNPFTSASTQTVNDMRARIRELRESIARKQLQLSQKEAVLDRLPRISGALTPPPQVAKIEKAIKDVRSRLVKAKVELIRATGEQELAEVQAQRTHSHLWDLQERARALSEQLRQPPRLALPVVNIELAPALFFSVAPAVLLVLHIAAVMGRLRERLAEEWLGREARANYVSSAFSAMMRHVPLIGSAAAIACDLVWTFTTSLLVWLQWRGPGHELSPFTRPFAVATLGLGLIAALVYWCLRSFIIRRLLISNVASP